MTYNGWSNYATWRINLELVSDYADMCQSDGQKWESVSDLAKAFEEYVDEILEQEATEGSTVLSYAQAFTSDVDWHEIAAHYEDELIESEEDEDEEELDDEDEE